MAAALNPDEVVRSSKGRENFQLLAGLLINRCAVLLLEITNARIQGKQFRNPALKKLVKEAVPTKPQRIHLRPFSSMYGKSTDFAKTRRFPLLTIKRYYIPPFMRWRLLAIKENIFEADLGKIIDNYILLYNYMNEDGKLSDDEFLVLWRDTSKALVRAADQISPAKAKEWKNDFDTLLKDPLTEEDKRNEQELQLWYHYWVEKEMEELARPEEIEPLIESLEEEAQSLMQKIRRGTQDIKDQLGGKVECTPQEVQRSGQDIKDQLRLKVSGPIPQLEVSLLIFFMSILY